MGLALSISLSERIAEHLAVTEGEGGLYAEIVAADPRLGFAVKQLFREHDNLRRGLRGGLTAAQEAELLTALDRHQRRGNDLMYEAYAVDLGGEN